MSRRALTILVAALGLVTVGLVSGSPTSSAATPAFAKPCGNSGPAGQVRHVIWIFMENESVHDVIGNANAPYQTSLARQCGLPSHFNNESHGSLDNYIAATSGQNILGSSFIHDCLPNAAAHYCVSTGSSIYAQVQAAGKTWRNYSEDMPSNCDRTNTGNYAVRHNPAVYFATLSSSAQFDVPMGSLTTQSGAFYTALKNGTLPNFTVISPNLLDDAHSSSTKVGDNWLSKIIPIITAGTNYQSGSTVIMITNDEGEGSDYALGEDCTNQALDATQGSCHVPTILVASHVPTGDTDGTYFTHYSMLRTTEELLGLPPLGRAAGANSMVTRFNLGTYSGGPSAPTNLTATTAGGKISLSWKASAAGVSSISRYRIIRDGVVMTTVSSPSTTFVDTTAKVGTTHSYAVAAVDSTAHVSVSSNKVSVTVH